MRKRFRLLLLVVLLIPVSGAAAASPNPATPGIDWLSKVTDQVNDLVTAHGDQLVSIGNTELEIGRAHV